MAALVSQEQSKNIYIEFINNTKKSYTKVLQKTRGRNVEEKIRNSNEGQINGNLNKCEQESLFLLLNSNLVYKMWYQMAFLNYIISHKKGWGSQSKSRFEKMMKNDFNGSAFKEDVELKDIINNSYFMRMVFIYEMIKSIHLTRSLIKILPNEGEEPLKKSYTRRPGRRRRRGRGRTKRGGQKGDNRGQYINRIMKIFKIGFCAVMWSIVCNNYYEKLETFGPQIESLITAHYGDVINQATINELENVRGVIVQYSRKIGNSNNEEDYQIRYNNIEDEIDVKDGAEQFSIEAGKGLIKRSNLHQVAPRESIVPASGASGPPAIRISYSEIASICGLGLGSMIFGKGDQIVDMVQTFEGEITNAFAKDTLNIIKKKVLEIKPVTAGSTGNNKGVFTKVGDVVTNLYASIFQSSSRSYTNAPGVQDTIQSYQRRATALRQRWTNWQSEANTANVNFIQDIILHIRNTSYYLWVYFVFMQALELYAVKKMLELVPGSLENREQRQRMLELVDDNPSVITTVRSRVENEARRMGGNRIIRGLTYWLLVAVFRGLAETIRFQIARPEGFTQVDIMDSIMRQDINPTIQQPGVSTPVTSGIPFSSQSSELLTDFRRENDREIRPQLLRQPSEDGVDISLEVGPADSDSFRTANGIKIPDEDIDVILIDEAINTIQEDAEDEYDIGRIVNRGGKRKKKKTRKKKKRKRKKKKTRKRRR
jgi:hypothetical protein